MRLNVSAWAIRSPIAPVILFLVLAVLGAASFRSLAVTRMPNIDLPIVSVAITQSGAAPEELQTQVTKWVEDSIAGIRGVKHITSTISEGASVSTIEFRLEVDVDRALNDVKDAVSRIRVNLPRTIEEPIISRVDIAGLPIMVYAVKAPAMTAADLSWLVEDKIARSLQAVRGVGGVERVGGSAREVRVTLQPDRLQALGVTAADVNAQLRITAADMAGGRGEVGGREQSIRTLAAASSIADLKATSIVVSGGRKVRLDELAEVTDTVEEARTFARFNGEPVVAFSVSRSSGASDAEVAAGVEKRITELQATYPDLVFEAIDSSVSATIGSYHSAMHTLFEGAALAVLVVFLFLKDWRATVIAAIALPLSIIPTFGAMHLLGFTLNGVSLLAITLVTGILVDDAIVEIENIDRHIRMGKSPYRAALEGADEIGLAVIAITAALIAVFAPVSFMPGIAGRYFVQFGLTIAISVFVSLLVARFVTPVLAAYFLRPTTHVEKREGRLMRAYMKVIGWTVRHRGTTLAVGLGLFAASLASTVLLPSGFVPRQDDARTLFMVELAPGATLSETSVVTDRIVARIRSLPEVKSVFVDGGRHLGKKDTRLAAFTINLTPKNERSLKQSAVETEIAALMAREPDIRSWKVGEGGQRDMALIVSGPDTATVTDVASRLQRDIAAIPNLVAVMSTAPLNRTEVRIRPKEGVAADLGVSTSVIADTVRVATIGDVGINLAKFNAGDRQIPIRVQLPQSERRSVAQLENLKIPTRNGAAVPLASVADIALNQGPGVIEHYDRAVRVAVEANMDGTDALGSLIAQAMATPTARNLPPGVTIRQTGDAEIMTEVFDGFVLAMGAGILMVYAVLVLLFGSFLQPITILSSLPLSLGGVILGLLLFNMPISMPVVIGVLMLMGLVTKNAIMLVDFAVEAMAKGVAPAAAIVEAGRNRARPIIMTTIAMAAGMVPSAMAFGVGGEFRAPMAVAVIGGLIVSTLLSLIFVPAMFLLMNGVGAALARVFGRFIGPRDEPPASLEIRG
ncbi:efflux RND transporter permease subunit [Tardiphaga sp.]|uniref:efflux RND transporter permease subunit n=1 Tax=Tardiphaga sp. TaxID=1926292 RepID=UPI0037DA481F